MANGEYASWEEAFANIDSLPSSLDAAMRNIIERSNEFAERIGKPSERIDIDPSTNLQLYTKNVGNQALIISGVGKSLNVGYYSPLYREFVTYPELVTLNELTALLPTLQGAREAAIDKFNTLDVGTRIDYDIPALQELHQTQHESLLESDFAAGIAHKYYLYTSRPPSDHIEIDDCTSMSVCLRPQHYGFGHSKPERFLSLRFLGSFYTDNGAKRRHAVHYIDIAKRSADVESMDFEIIDDLVSGGELRHLINMAIDLKIIESQIPRFSTFELGIIRKPGEPDFIPLQ